MGRTSFGFISRGTSIKSHMTDQSKSHIIAADQRLSQSLIWQMQRAYFLQNGMKAWQEDVVPHQISSNPLMGRTYSQLVLAYLRDCTAAGQHADFQLNPDQPLYIVELGAGPGRLAHHFLTQFQPLLARSPLADWQVKYVMTDFVPEIVSFWLAHERFQSWFDAGWLDAALFDVTAPRPLQLQHARLTLTPELMQNPVILIANYFFDSIPQDSFTIEGGQLCQNLLTLTSSHPEPDLTDPTLWERLELTYEAIPLAGSAYDEPAYNQILAEYEAEMPDTTLTFPNAGLDCLRFWQEFGNGRLLLLSSDRGATAPQSLLHLDDPLPNLHGSFSFMVNFHAISRFVELAGGAALHAGHYQDHLQTAVYLFGQLPQAGLETKLAFQHMCQQGSPDDYFGLKQALEPHLNNMTLPQLLNVLRLMAWDADIFRDGLPTLKRRVEEVDPVWFEDVLVMVEQVWQQYLPLTEEDDLGRQIEALLRLMGVQNAAQVFHGRQPSI